MEELREKGRQWVNAQLLSDEFVLWSGSPVKGKWFRKSDAFMIPFSVLWCGFAIFWELNALKSGGLFFSIWGIPFVCVGLYIVFGRFFYQQYVKRNTYYAVTNKRILRYQRNRTDSLMLDRIPSVSREVRRDGTGTVTFGDAGPTITFSIQGTRSARRPEPLMRLEDIPEAERVYRIIMEQMGLTT